MPRYNIPDLATTLHPSDSMDAHNQKRVKKTKK
jgi:hypothetical protein